MERKYRVAIIGTGRMGGFIDDEATRAKVNSFMLPYAHMRGYAAIPEVEVVAAANRGEERLERFCRRFGIENGYLDYEEMILKEKPDIVSVTTPTFARAKPVIFAAEHGVRGIYAEKGLCASLEEADRIRKACAENGVAFNWGAMRRHHDGYKRLRDAVVGGEIGEPRFAAMYFYSDLIKHHPHSLDLVGMLLGDPDPLWVEGRLVEPGDRLAPNRPLPVYDPGGRRFVPPEGMEKADPMVGYYRVGYAGGVEGIFMPLPGRFDVEVHGTNGRAYAWDNGEEFAVRKGTKNGADQGLTLIRPRGDSPTVTTIRNIIRELETGERTDGNIDVTMKSVEVQFGLAESHLQGGRRVELPLKDRSLYIPGG